MRRPELVSTVARFGLIPKLVAIALLELTVLWLFGRWTRRRATPG